MGSAEGTDQRGQDVGGRDGAGADHGFSAQPAAEPGQGFQGLLLQAEDAAGVVVEQAARRGGLGLAAEAVHQFLAEFLLQVADVVAHRGLGEEYRPGRTGEAFQFDHLAEHVEFADIHGRRGIKDGVPGSADRADSTGKRCTGRGKRAGLAPQATIWSNRSTHRSPAMRSSPSRRRLVGSTVSTVQPAVAAVVVR